MCNLGKHKDHQVKMVKKAIS